MEFEELKKLKLHKCKNTQGVKMLDDSPWLRFFSLMRLPPALYQPEIAWADENRLLT